MCGYDVIMTSSAAATKAQPRTSPAGVKTGGAGRANAATGGKSADAAGRKAAEEEVERLNGVVS